MARLIFVLEELKANLKTNVSYLEVKMFELLAWFNSNSCMLLIQWCYTALIKLYLTLLYLFCLIGSGKHAGYRGWQAS